MLPPYGMSPVKASTHRKIKLTRKNASTKNVCECLLIFAEKLSLISVAPLLYIPGLGVDS